MSNPSISVITPNLNRGRFLERAICSVIDQGYENLEYWVIDGGSEDESLDLLCRYDEDLTGWISQANLGISDAINKGLSCATGDIIAVLGADDIYLPGALEAVAAEMSRPDGPDWVVGHCMRVNSRDEMLGWVAPSRPKTLASFLMHDSGVLPTAATFFRRELLDKHGAFDVSVPLAFDYEYTCRLLAAGETATLIPQTLVARREHASANARNTIARGLEYIQTARCYADHLPLTQRYSLWRNCDLREKIYKLAEAEIHGDHARRFLWQELLRHPWWLADDAVRRALRQGGVETGTEGRQSAAA